VFWKQSGTRIKVAKARIASMTIDLKAGDVSRFSTEVVGAEYVADNGSSSMVDCQKLLTWDVCTVSATPVSDPISSFTLTISNPPMPIYTAKWSQDPESGGMMPQKIRVGMQEVSGTIGVYGDPQVNIPSSGTVKFGLRDVEKEIRAVFSQPRDEGSGGPYVRTISFNGANDGTIWV